MSSVIGPEAARDEIRAALDAVDAAYARLRAVSSDVVGNGFRVEVTERLETQDRVNRGLMYRFFGEIVEPRRRARRSRPARRHRDEQTAVAAAARSRPARSAAGCASPPASVRADPLTGPVLPPELPHLAAAVEDGEVGGDHIAAVCHALDVLPSVVPDNKREKAERIMVRHARCQDAKFVTVIGRRIADHLNPDGLFDENDRARRRGLHLTPQGPDGMSRLSGWLDPEARAYLEAVNAAVRPGRHQPDGEACEEVQPDTRSGPQRLHDALKLGLKAAIASTELGQHRGLAVTVIATTTLRELNRAAHAVNDPNMPMPPPARTGGGSALPMRDLIRMAADAIHYLAVFDDHTGRPLYLGRSQAVSPRPINASGGTSRLRGTVTRATAGVPGPTA